MILRTKFKPLLSCTLLCFMLICPALAWANQTTDSLFHAGNEAYAQSKYENAIASYQQLIKEGYQSAPLYYNLGNAYFKTGDIASSLLYLEKAHKLAPGDEDINANIQFVNSKTTDKMETVPEFFLYKWWRSVMLYFSIDTLAILSSGLISAGFLILIVFLFSRNILLRKACFYLGVLFIVAGTCAVIITVKQNNYFASNRQAIIFNSSVTAKSEPVNLSKDIFVVHAGTKVNILDHRQDWIKITLPNGNTGWINANAVKTI